MKPTQKLHQDGQSLWLDNITRDLLTSGTLQQYIDELGITGLTSNPTIFDNAFLTTDAYDDAIVDAAGKGLDEEDIFFDLAIEDLQGAADLFRHVSERTNGVDGWVSLEVSPRIAYDPKSTIKAAIDLHTKADRPNLFIKIPATAEGLPAIEEAIFAGVPSTSRCSSRVSSTSPRRTPTCAASSDASTRISIPSSAPSPPCSSAGGTPRTSRRSNRTSCRTCSGSQWRSGRTRRTARSSTPTAGSASPTKGRAHSVCSGRAPGRRTPKLRTCSTSARWRRR